MKNEPLRRVFAVLLGYAGLAWLALLLGGWLRRVLALPGLFDTLLRGGILLGVPVAILVAWHYPSIGHGDASFRASGPRHNVGEGGDEPES